MTLLPALLLSLPLLQAPSLVTGMSDAATSPTLPEASSAATTNTKTHVGLASAAPAGPKRQDGRAPSSAGDLNVLISPSGRTLREDDVSVTLEELVFWRIAWGASDRMTAELRTLWGASLGVGLKYGLVQTPHHHLALGASADALVFAKTNNFEMLSLTYTYEEPKTSLHLGGHFVRAQQRLSRRRSRVFVIPEGTAGAELRFARHVRGLIEVGYGQDLRTGNGSRNTGFINLGVRLADRSAFAEVAIVSPTHETWLQSDRLGIPWFRFGFRL